MNLLLKRTEFTPDYTEGVWYVDGVYFCDTVEDCYRDLSKEEKVSGKTCIPKGTYPVILSFSNRFQKILPEVQNVPFFTGVRIHSGNSASDSEGCIIVGKKGEPGKVTDSQATKARLMTVIDHAIKVKGETVTLEITT